MRPASGRPADDEAGSKKRHPTALWMPDVEEMRRRLEQRIADARAASADATRHGGAVPRG